MKTEGVTISNKDIIIDGNVYKDVVFIQCNIIFSGEKKDSETGLMGCKFKGCKWHFTGSAGYTVFFLKSLKENFGINGDKFIKSIFEN